MEAIMGFMDAVNSVAWGWPGMIVVVGGGLYLTIRLRGFQFVNFGRSLRFITKGATPDLVDTTKVK